MIHICQIWLPTVVVATAERQNDNIKEHPLQDVSSILDKPTGYDLDQLSYGVSIMSSLIAFEFFTHQKLTEVSKLILSKNTLATLTCHF